MLNIASLKDQQKFRFDLFNDEKWDIEHIHSQIEKEKFNQKECREWLEMFEEFYGTNEDEVNKEISEIRENIQNFKVSKDEEIDLQKFNELYDLVYNDLKISSLNIRNDEETHNIGNLTLLDSKTNRSYKNTWFLFKRKIILQNDSLGKFIPIATKNIFTKVYSSSVTDLLAWTNSDQENYKTKMKEIINGFLEV